MAQVINTNNSSLFSAQTLNKSNIALQTAMNRLSSGLRINSAKDDPTGLVTSTVLDTLVRGTNMAARNAADGISSAQTNDGYLAQISANLQRLSEIAVQTGGTATSVEATALVTENTRITSLIVSTGSVVNNADGTSFSGTGTAPTAPVALTVSGIASDLSNINTARANYGSDMTVLSSAVANLQLASVNVSAQYSRIMDTDYAAETGNMTRNQILQQAGTAMLAQANQVPNGVLALLR